ncbi:MAG: hypothetical protein KGL12_09025 [Rhodospirillales bacterium]|nr:hypothetical protein [Rhodospirillales bacterium]
MAEAIRDAAPRPRLALRVSADRVALILVLGAAYVLRLYVIATHRYVAAPDETFQYFEQAHRLVFGSGVVPWEYIDGIRSWLLPGLIAVLMRLTDWLVPGSIAYIALTRALVAALSLLPVAAAFVWLRRGAGLGFAVAGALFVATAYDLVLYAPAVLTEMLASYAALAAIGLGEGTQSRARRIASGACYGLACCLRFQYGPPLVLAAAWQCGRGRQAWLAVLVGGLAVAIPVAGLLDWVTWGTPFQSIWLNVVLNTRDHVASAMGVAPDTTYAVLLLGSWTLVGVSLAALGAVRAPALALTAAAILIEHSLIAHKEYRFIFFTLMSMPILISLGMARLCGWLARLRGAGRAAMTIAMLSLLVLQGVNWDRMLQISATYWHHDTAVLALFQAAHDDPATCGLGVRSLGWQRTGGYSYFNRNLPIYYSRFDPAQRLPGSSAVLRSVVVLRGHALTQYPGAALARHSAAFNTLIAAAGHGLPGFVPRFCRTNVTRSGAMPLCLYTRPGPCR